MLYVEISTHEWSKKYKIPITVFTCKKCSKDFETTVPIMVKGYAGLETPEHGCGRNSLSAVFKPIAQNEISFWEDFSLSSGEPLQC